MPNLTFVLPHWLYWSGLILIPLFAIHTVRKQKIAGKTTGGLSIAITYMLWLTSGFIGIHRFYLRDKLGAVYIPFFIAILYGNVKNRAARNALSEAKNMILNAKFDLEHMQKLLERGAEGAAAKVAKAQQALTAIQEEFKEIAVNLDYWHTFTFVFALLIAAFLIADAFLLPRLYRRCAEREEKEEKPHEASSESFHRDAEIRNYSLGEPHNFFTKIVDAFNGWVGHFICYWSMIAVFVYYYEVLARYVFNSPTNWAHEGMFLMFGMQYLIAGGFALREDSHVRVDVLYVHMSRKVQAVVDILTSFFFFLFSGALMWTGFIFMMDSVNVWEVSFTEWAIQYWPVKSTLAIGALLVLLQGLSKLMKDIMKLAGKEA
ncbi:MAG: TRAP transporter small permease subunit [bacterium]|nr:TRAP transporter small permease subunit [bacterium]